ILMADDLVERLRNPSLRARPFRRQALGEVAIAKRHDRRENLSQPTFTREELRIHRNGYAIRAQNGSVEYLVNLLHDVFLRLERHPRFHRLNAIIDCHHKLCTFPCQSASSTSQETWQSLGWPGCLYQLFRQGCWLKIGWATTWQRPL